MLSHSALSPAYTPAASTGTATVPLRPDTPTERRTSAAALAAALAAAAEHWLGLVEYRPASRWTHLLSTDDAAAALDPSLHADLTAAQVWLLSWLPDQGTPLHDHGRSAGAFAVVRGTLTERVASTGRLERPVPETTVELTVGRIRHFGPHYVHQVTNTARGPAVSVHVYTPALTEMNTYSAEGDRLVHIGTEQAGVDW
jgi:predicted metal-dependent enzyme (double-stranded beta helix superfamily)